MEEKVSYFLVWPGDDGTEIEELTKEELLKRISPDEDGDFYYGEEFKFLDKIPEIDKGDWGQVPDNVAVVIEGKIVKPRSVKVVTKYEV